MNFWMNFDRICRERGTTPTTVVKALGLSTSKLSLWKGGSLPKQDVLVALAKYLDCQVMDFFAEDESVHEPTDDDESDILRIYRMMPREEKHKFMARMYAYYEELTK